MNIERENIGKAKKLIEELEMLEDAIDITRNYDASIMASFFTLHNHNTKTSKSVEIPISNDIEKAIIKNVHERIEEIKKELEKM